MLLKRSCSWLAVTLAAMRVGTLFGAPMLRVEIGDMQIPGMVRLVVSLGFLS